MSKAIEETINSQIHAFAKDKQINTENISDGYHTFGELYEHRIMLFLALCRTMIARWHGSKGEFVWRSVKHSDGSNFPGWFIVGLSKIPGEQITYHLPMKYWKLTDFIETLDKAPIWDGHTSADVLGRLQKLL